MRSFCLRNEPNPNLTPPMDSVFRSTNIDTHIPPPGSLPSRAAGAAVSMTKKIKTIMHDQNLRCLGVGRWETRAMRGRQREQPTVASAFPCSPSLALANSKRSIKQSFETTTPKNKPLVLFRFIRGLPLTHGFVSRDAQCTTLVNRVVLCSLTSRRRWSASVRGTKPPAPTSASTFPRTGTSAARLAEEKGGRGGKVEVHRHNAGGRIRG